MIFYWSFGKKTQALGGILGGIIIIFSEWIVVFHFSEKIKRIRHEPTHFLILHLQIIYIYTYFYQLAFSLRSISLSMCPLDLILTHLFWCYIKCASPPLTLKLWLSSTSILLLCTHSAHIQTYNSPSCIFINHHLFTAKSRQLCWLPFFFLSLLIKHRTREIEESTYTLHMPK